MIMNINISAKEIWLTYFNNALFEQGVITEKEKNKMSALISNYCYTNKPHKQNFVKQP